MQHIARRFTSWAPAYETDGLSRLLVRLEQQAIVVLRPTSADTFLDVGCGSGAAVREVASVVRMAVGVDVCWAMVDRAQELGRSIGPAGFVCADAHDLPFDDRASRHSATTLSAWQPSHCCSHPAHVADCTAPHREVQYAKLHHVYWAEPHHR